MVLILRNAEPKFLMPVPKLQWYGPSQRVGLYDIQDKVTHKVTAKLNDGHNIWEGFFEDRDDFDTFLDALFKHCFFDTPIPARIRRLSTPEWYGALGTYTDLTYYFATLVDITATPGSNQNYTIPADWSTNNQVDCIGAGGGGAGGNPDPSDGGGGGGGAFARSVGLTGLSGTVTRRLGSAGAGGSYNYGSSGTGGDTWFNDTAFPTTGQRCGAKGGLGRNNNGANPNGSGGQAASCYATGTGNATRNGGNGSAAGGGAAGPNAAGNNGSGNNGGSGDGGSGGTGGVGANGGAGSEYAAGIGSGGGGARYTASNGFAGGNYGAAGGGGSGSGGTGGNGTQGIIHLEYTPGGGSFVYNTYAFQHMIVR